MNTFVQKHEAMLSLFHPYIRRREICIMLLINLQGLTNYNIFVEFTKFLSKLSLTILILIKNAKLVGFTKLISYFFFYCSYLGLSCILLSPSP